MINLVREHRAGKLQPPRPDHHPLVGSRTLRYELA
jgi:hypothetical protein